MANIQFKTITTPGGYQPGGDITSSAGAIEQLISNILVAFTVFAGIAFTLYFLIGGINWITAGGDKDKIEKAKGMLTNGAIGLIIIVVSYSLVWIIGKALGLDILDPAKIISGIKFK